VEFLADVGIELIQYANWYSVIAFYEDTNTEMNYMFNHFRRQLALRGMNKTLAHSSILHPDHEHIPLKFAVSHYATRIVFLMAEGGLARRVLCEAFKVGVLHPHYQWVIFRTPLDDILVDNSVHNRSGGQCSREIITTVLEQAILLGYEDFREKDTLWTTKHPYVNALLVLLRGIGLSQAHNISLNTALRQLKTLAEKLVFIWQIERTTVVLVGHGNTTTTFARYDESAFNLLHSNFTKVSDTVPSGIFYFTLAFLIIQTLCTVVLHVLTIRYRKFKAIRATSPNIQHLAYIGVYLLICSNLIYTTQKSLQMDDKVYVQLCITYTFFLNVARTLLLSSLCVRAWRLYRIFNHYMDPGNLLSDKVLVLIVLGTTVGKVAASTLGVVADSPFRTERLKWTNYERRLEIVQDVCEERFTAVWLLIGATYDLILLSVAVILSIRVKSTAPKYQKEFRRNEVTLLTYLIAIIVILGLPVYYLAKQTGDLLLEYLTVVPLFSCYTTAYLVFFFASPLYRAVREQNHFLSEHLLA
jgi:heme/copper-type cytochrome/quinol oxidase subunit 2